MKQLLLAALAIALAAPTALKAQTRAMWASINTVSNASLGGYTNDTGKLLISWRMLPDDDADMAFYLFRRGATNYNVCTRVTATPVAQSTCYQMASSLPTTPTVFYLLSASQVEALGIDKTLIMDADLCRQIRETALDSLVLGEHIYKDKLPYVSIPLRSTEDVDPNPDIVYYANDCSVGDLDGDGQMEIVVKRLLGHKSVGSVDEGIGGSSSDMACRHTVIWDAYKLDGTFMWRIKSGPNIILGNSSNFGIADLDGDGRAEMVTRTAEGTVFGDGTEIGDTNGDGMTDYRTNTGGWVDHYTSRGPDFFSVIDGLTGRELARADFIDRGTDSNAWGDNYWKRANSLRLGIASFDGRKNQIFLGRGVYARTVIEGWDYEDGQLTRLWHFDSSASGGRDKNKDGKANSAYAGQGNHSFSVADLDGDGRDEVMYGSCAFDDDGTGLWSTQLGHGDAQHVGKFIADREGLQVFHCLESGRTQVALHDARDGSTIWSQLGSSDNDTGRCLIDDIDPNNPGCEVWWAGSNAYSVTGKDLGYKPASCNMSIWFDGTLSRQLINENIIHSPANGRTFTIYRYDMGFNNGSKSNPGWYGDILGDWREEFIVPSNDHLTDLKVFSTWYPTTHKFPWLMTDHTYFMSAVNENVGYNQPTHTGYYLGSDLRSDADAWQAAKEANTAVSAIAGPVVIDARPQSDDAYYNLLGQKVASPVPGNIYIHRGKKTMF